MKMKSWGVFAILTSTLILIECSTSRRISHFKRSSLQSYYGKINPMRNIWAFHSSHDTNYENTSHNYGNTKRESLHLPNLDDPIFDINFTINVTALLGKTAVLNCRVKNIGNKTVSWVRHRDIHLLTVGKFSYTSDQRFSAIHSDGSEDWLLKIHYLQNRDEGWYDCQISATPPRSYKIYLSIVEPETKIEGSKEVYINRGSRLALTCSVHNSPEPPAFIFWYHDDKLVSYDHSNDGFEVKMEKGKISKSRLLIDYAETHHSGIYTCDPANSNPKKVNVHVIAGEQPAAIQHDNNGISGALNKSTYPLLSAASLIRFTFIQVIIFKF